MMRLRLIEAPAALPVTLTDVKAHTRFESDHEDSVLLGQIASAVDLLDGPTGILGRAILTQVWRLELATWPGSMVIPIEPVQSVAITYLGAQGATETVSPGQYYLSGSPGQASSLHWSTGWVPPALMADADFPVLIDITAGFGGPEATPPAISQAIMMMVAHWHQNREGQGQIPATASALLSRYRRFL
ncbi:head-tail connector protein [Pontitalea aquivivens]|uniref:head-tail connector protein n=1 Tax=Pontitalea aquivivens TaxID=3388663 RepID=UPI0039707660